MNERSHRPPILKPHESYTFRSYFLMKFAPADILRELGATLIRAAIQKREHFKKLNEQLQNVNIPAQERFIGVDFTPIWSEYLELLNIIYLLADCSMHNTKRNIYGLEYSELRVKDILRVRYKDGLPISQVTYGNENANTMEANILHLAVETAAT